MKTLAFVTNTIPNKDHSTATYCAYLVIEAFQKQGYRVAVLIAEATDYQVGTPQARAKWMEEVKKLGIEPVFLTLPQAPQPILSIPARILQGLRRILFALIPDYFPAYKYRDSMRAALEALKPEALFIWGDWDTIAATNGLPYRKFAMVGDPPHFVHSARENPPFKSAAAKLSPRWWYHALLRCGLARAAIKLLRDVDGVGATASHHSQWIRSQGIDYCRYVPNIVPDWGGADWQEKKKKQQNTSHKTRVLLMGHLTSTVNGEGLDYLATEIIPALNKLAPGEFDINVCGKGELPPQIKAKLTDPSLKFRGFVDDIVAEIQQADIFLVSTHIELGIRVRIPYVWSAGVCVVSHSANAKGLPELKHEENCLLGSSGEEIAAHMVRLRRDTELRKRLEAGGRRTYETMFSEGVTTAKIIEPFNRVLEKGAARS